MSISLSSFFFHFLLLYYPANDHTQHIGLQSLTGGVLLLRNKYYIIIYRGKDFLPTTVAAALAEREELTKHIQVVEEKVRSGGAEASPSGEDGVGQPLAGTLAEFYEAQARWGREISTEEHEKMIEEASRAKNVRVVKRIEHKLALVSVPSLPKHIKLGKHFQTFVIYTGFLFNGHKWMVRQLNLTKMVFIFILILLRDFEGKKGMSYAI